MTEAQYIAGLMAETTNVVQPGCFSLIPPRTIEHQYIRNGRYVLQHDRRGRCVGYLLHGALKAGRPLHLTQVCIEYDLWQRGHGIDAIHEVFRRAERAQVSSIVLRCAVDLPALEFWKSIGFSVISIVPGGEKRKRLIAVLGIAMKTGLWHG